MVRLTGTNTEIGQGQADIMADRQTAAVSVFEQRVMVVVAWWGDWPMGMRGGGERTDEQHRDVVYLAQHLDRPMVLNTAWCL